MNARRLFWAVPLCLVWAADFGQTRPASFDDSQPTFFHHSIKGLIDGFLDPTGEMTFDQARAARFVSFDSIAAPVGYVKNNRPVVWLRCPNPVCVDGFWFFGERTLSTTGFRVSGDGSVGVFENGKTVAGRANPSFFLTPLPFSADTAEVWYFRLKSFPFKATRLEPTVFSEEAWLAAKAADYHANRAAVNWLIGLGAVLAFMVLFSITQWGIHREAVFLFYAGYLVSALTNIYRCSLDFVVPATSVGRFFAFHGNMIATALGHFFYLWFVIEFLGLRTTAPWFFRFLKIAAWASVASLAAYFLLFHAIERQDWAEDFYNFIRWPLLAVVVFGFGVVVRRRFPFYGFILAGGIPMAFGATWWMIFGLRSRLGLPTVVVNPNLMFYACAAVESLVFMSGLGYKFAITEQSKRRAQEKLLAERARISRDLHDDVGATLNSLALLAEVSKRQSENIPASTLHSLDQIKKIARDCARRVSDLVWSASPKSDSLGDLTARMRDFSHQLFQGEAVRVRFGLPHSLDALPLAADRRWNLYFIYKEAMNNARKYSGATQIEVTMSQAGGQILLSIKDNGRGFDQLKTQPGNGLLTMSERAKMLGGEFSFTSKEGEGTSVDVSFPLKINQLNHAT